MAKKEQFLELALRCEEATGPDRALDAEIAPLVGLRVVDEGHPLGRCCYDIHHNSVLLPRFTASIDAAMTLVPLGWAKRYTECPKAHYPARWALHPPHKVVPAINEDFDIQAVGYLSAATLAAASLRALADQEGE